MGVIVSTDNSFASPPAAYTVAEFCAAHRISQGAFHKLTGLGLSPRMMRVGVKNLISVEAARDWRVRMEALTAERYTSTTVAHDSAHTAA